MSKGTQTRERIVAQAAQLFSRQGYFGSSLSDIMRETGLEKGGIYNHFVSKEQLALESFDYAYGLIQQRIKQALSDKRNAVDRLIALVAVFQSIIDDPPVAGGCPILNTAIEADDAEPALRERAFNAMQDWRETIRRIVSKGIERGEIRPDTDGDMVATLLITSLEGAVMMSKLCNDNIHMYRVVAHCTNYLETSVRT